MENSQDEKHGRMNIPKRNWVQTMRVAMRFNKKRSTITIESSRWQDSTNKDFPVPMESYML
jgi:hypothetical protein